MAFAVKYPDFLKKGDKIAVVAPSGPVKREYIDSTATVLERVGYEPVIYPSCYGKLGYLSGPASERFADLKDAFLNKDIKAILCARGGYGMVHNLDSLALLPLEENAKWVIGYSDISALHALMASKGVSSIHASMASKISEGENKAENSTLFRLLEGELPEYEFEAHEYNHEGTAEGLILGGNLAVIQALINTPYDIIKPGTILFVEDISEPIYKIERMFWQLKMAGILDNLKGLIIGQFTDYESNAIYDNMEDMLSDMLKDYPELPVAFNAPIGHFSGNVPIIESAIATLQIDKDSVKLKFYVDR